METVLVLVRVALAAVLLVAALTKLAQRRTLPETVRGLGIPEPLVPLVAAALPVVELVLAVGLLPGATAWMAAAATATLFAAFTALVATNLVRGRRPACNCFGQMSAEPISNLTIVRNAVLTTAAAIPVLSDPFDAGPGLFAWSRTIVDEPGDIGLWLALLSLGVIAQNALLLYRTRGHRPATSGPGAAGGSDVGVSSEVRLEPGLPVNTQAPGFSLPNLEGDDVTLDDLLGRGKGVVLVFTSPTCGPCSTVMPDLAAWQHHRPDLTIAILSSGDELAIREKAETYDLMNVLVDAGSEVATTYRYEGTPGAVAIRPDGALFSPIASGTGPVLDNLMEFSMALGAEVPLGELSVGEPAPPLKLPTTHGHPLDLNELRGHTVLVVFWDPVCGFCQRLLPELRLWEADEAEGKVWLLLVSKGDPDLITVQGFQSHVALDPASAVARSFGGFGTPTAILIDAEGKVASELVAGGDDVMTLARRSVTLAEAAATLAELKSLDQA